MHPSKNPQLWWPQRFADVDNLTVAPMMTLMKGDLCDLLLLFYFITILNLFIYLLLQLFVHFLPPCCSTFSGQLPQRRRPQFVKSLFMKSWSGARQQILMRGDQSSDAEIQISESGRTPVFHYKNILCTGNWKILIPIVNELFSIRKLGVQSQLSH
jgi:hypothetical protein